MTGMVTVREEVRPLPRARPSVSGGAPAARLLHEFLLTGASLAPDRTAMYELGEGGVPHTFGYRELERLVHGYAAG
ncbi:hypothetical protein [Streptomyces sp. NPDC059168]|uniref:hypothetical protein n=1 Tax=Streptomyces sp. NPDC059168 TaxID=3346753 RepID=UPI0036CA6163